MKTNIRSVGNAVKQYKVWQSYVDAPKENIQSDYAIHAAECFAELHCLGRDTLVYFVGNHGNNTKKFHNNEIGCIYVTEINTTKDI